MHCTASWRTPEWSRATGDEFQHDRVDEVWSSDDSAASSQNFPKIVGANNSLDRQIPDLRIVEPARQSRPPQFIC